MTEDQKDEIRALIREVLAEDQPPAANRPRRDTISILTSRFSSTSPGDLPVNKS
jgi:hypothetical protein